MELTTKSLRRVRTRAAIPRLIAIGLVTVLSLTGLRVIIAGPPSAPAAPAVHVAPADDTAAEAFAEGFAREYLTWDGADLEERATRLLPYTGGTLDDDAGLTPATDSSQSVSWTAVSDTRRTDHGIDVVVVAATSDGETRLSVPVARDAKGFLAIASYPAILGPPPTTEKDVAGTASESEVDDTGLLTVAQRAVTNYLAGEQDNLLADLTPDAVVALPEQRLRATDVSRISWIRPRRTVAVEVEAQDKRGDTWTLRYALEVRHTDRWYVRSFHVNPTEGK